MAGGGRRKTRDMKDDVLACRPRGTTTNTGPGVKEDPPQREAGSLMSTKKLRQFIYGRPKGTKT